MARSPTTTSATCWHLSARQTLPTRKQNNLPLTNGFGYVLGTLTNPTQIADYNQQLKGGSKPPPDQFKDFTAQKAVTIDMAVVTSNSSGFDFRSAFHHDQGWHNRHLG